MLSVRKISHFATPLSVGRKSCYSTAKIVKDDTVLDLPYFRWTGQAPGAVFFPGLTAYSWNGDFASCMLDHVKGMRNKGFFRFQNGFSGNLNTEFSFRNLFEDADAVMRFLCQTEPPQKRVLVGCGSGALAALHTASKFPELTHSVLLFSPWVHMKHDSIEDIVPGSLEKFRSGKTVTLVNQKHDERTEMGQKAWTELTNSSILTGHLYFKCPITIIHGCSDRLIPVERILLFAEQLMTSNLDVYIVENQGHVYNLSPEIMKIVDSSFKEKKATRTLGTRSVTTLKLQSDPISKLLSMERPIKAASLLH